MRILFISFLSFFVFCNISFAQQAKLVKILDGFDKPVSISFLPNRSKKIAVLEKSGELYVVHRDSPKNKELLFDLSNASGVRHPLDFIFHPDYSKNGRLFISFFLETTYGADLIVSEFVKSTIDKKILPSTENEILRLKQDKTSSRISPLMFDSKNALLIGVSDGAKPFDPNSKAQNLKNFYGSILRLNVEDPKNIIPSIDNPYVLTDRGEREIFAFGLRDPSSIVMDPVSKDIFIGERGNSLYDEINVLQPAANYGWPVFEGTTCLRMRFECVNYKTKSSFLKLPHKKLNQILLAGVVKENLIFAETQKGEVWAVNVSDSSKLKKLLESKIEISAFASDTQGELYVSDKKGGDIYHIQIESN